MQTLKHSKKLTFLNYTISMINKRNIGKKLNNYFENFRQTIWNQLDPFAERLRPGLGSASLELV